NPPRRSPPLGHRRGGVGEPGGAARSRRADGEDPNRRPVATRHAARPHGPDGPRGGLRGRAHAGGTPPRGARPPPLPDPRNLRPTAPGGGRRQRLPPPPRGRRSRSSAPGAREDSPTHRHDADALNQTRSTE